MKGVGPPDDCREIVGKLPVPGKRSNRAAAELARTSALTANQRIGGAAMPSKRLEEPRTRPAGADFEFNPFGAPRTVPHIGRAVSIGIYPGVDIAADEMDAEELVALWSLGLSKRGRGTGEIEMTTFFCHEFTALFGRIDSFERPPTPFYFGPAADPTSDWSPLPSQLDSRVRRTGLGKFVRTLTEQAGSDTVERKLALVLAVTRERNDRCVFIIPATATTPHTRDLGILQTLERSTD